MKLLNMSNIESPK